MEKKTGIIKVVAKTGGIIFEGEETYWNPSAKCKEYVTPELKGKKVEVGILDPEKRTFSFISPVKTEQKEAPKSETFTKATEYVPSNEERTNSMAISYAKDLVVAGKIDLSKMGQFAVAIKQFIKTGNLSDIIEEEKV